MAEYRITFARSARRELEALDTTIVNRIFPIIEGLSEHPRPRNCVKLQGGGSLWRIRVGVYRVIYSIDDTKKLIDVIAARHRRDAYR
ncbi:MAG: type II toxin-antitoxin system RelE family toxin [Planctomycetota bacterium]|jgi:mRNA interferase RelE/StbE